MEVSVSTVAFRSNLYPLEKSFYEDSTFSSKIHDPFSLEVLKKCGGAFTSLQKTEYEQASVHCAYAAPNDYPWGTIRDEQGNERVICRCLNAQCSYFRSCRPDFDSAELTIHEENRKVQPAVFEFEESQRKRPIEKEGDIGAAAILFAADRLKDDYADEAPILASTEEETENETENDPFVIRKSVSLISKPMDIKKNDSCTFVETTQTEIIETEPVERSIINAGPGTGKTWTLIEKIIYMINEELAAPENILVLCFSRSAVEVVRSRLSDAAEAGRIGYEWQNVDVRTFDSFSTYMLAWVQDTHNELLPNHFRLETCDYDQRIKVATSIFRRKKDILAEYEHIIVDEVQDLVGYRAELVLAMLKGLPDTCGFTILGDSCQSLYDYVAEDDPSLMSSEQFYQNIFRSFPKANYCALTENHRQDDAFGKMTIPYRNAILGGSMKDCISAADNILSHIPKMPIKLTAFSKEDALRYVSHDKTLGILTRTNGQALQISTWLQNSNVPHALQRGLGSSALGDWISCVFCNYENESVDETAFVSKHLAVFPKTGYETAQTRWIALVSTQNGETRNRYEVADLLKGLLRNARESVLFESGTDQQFAITVSNIHRAKGKEFDSVILIDDVIEPMTNPKTANLLEHKVCYVALTRPKRIIERVEFSQKDKKIYTIWNADRSNRCIKPSANKQRISHFEIGNNADLDMNSFAVDKSVQKYIREKVYPGMRIRLIKCREETKPYIVYRIVPEDDEKMTLGYTSRSFAHQLEKAIQRIKSINCPVFYKLYPPAFCDAYIHKITTCVSVTPPAPVGATSFGDISIWSGIIIAGFAAADYDTY